MGYLGRRIGKAQNQGDSNPAGADGAVGGGILDLFANGYFERQGGIYNDPGLGPQTGISATGGIINDYAVGPTVYRAHVFTTTDTFDVTDLGTFGGNIDYLIVGGGGGGGGGYEAGGGGAGGYRTTLPEGPGGGGSAEAVYPVAIGAYTVVVGGGGNGGNGGSGDGDPNSKGVSGNQSWFTPTPVNYPHPTYIRSEGGGGGGTYSPSDPKDEAIGKNGGSGGGAANCHPTGPAAGGTANRIADTSTAVPTQGYGGGNRGPQPHAPYYNGAGGGGAGAAGADQNDNTFPGSFGGNGKRTTITGPAYTIGTPGPASAGGTGGGDSTAVTGGWLSGGGGGGLYQYSPTASLPQTRGAGGGGAGGNGGSVVDATDAVASTGGGGGGSGHSGRVGGAGGSGIVVIRYQIGELVAPQNKATGGSITSYAPNDPSPMAGKTVHVFTASGVFNNTTGSPITGGVFLAVGGGGAGSGTNESSDGSAGGGAGGVLSNHGDVPGSLQVGFAAIGTAPYTVTVGAGGAAGTFGAPTNPFTDGSPGTSSTFGTAIAASGGGGGSLGAGEDGQDGGSGGGSSGGGSAGNGGVGNRYSPDSSNYPGNHPNSENQGQPGGKGNVAPINNYGAGGGGGFTQAGEGGGDGGGNGGAGLDISITGVAIGYAGGGGGGAAIPRPVTHHGTATHGGGAGATGNPGSTIASVIGQSGTQNTGGGGGGGAGGPFPGMPTADKYLTSGGAGGSGIVVIAYPT